LPYQVLADAVLLLHFGIVIFVILGLPVILLGNRVGWSWVNLLWWRLAHLAAIGVVVVQAWLGNYCPLTVLESSLREQAGQLRYERSFVEHWLQRVLYYEASMWVFAMAYTGFALLVALAWWRYPPRIGDGKSSDT
jgi:polyferredoxin